MSDDVWKQATLPVGKGGLGIRRAEQIALPAYLASIYSARRLVSEMVADFDVDDLCADELASWSVQSGTEPPIAALRGVQRVWG
ncbi:hypothetical protein RvY_12256 [Ramazzottius varieornatus]|uniref:Uncharacterized protein n=1 Tax=Ramazzottius varieornatus TaxID=947166 RepID=A0A1D1VIV2_RAMVA|nr:hypothetical protein RvY_12256 [Ramazzottius varieornatus]